MPPPKISRRKRLSKPKGHRFKKRSSLVEQTECGDEHVSTNSDLDFTPSTKAADVESVSCEPFETSEAEVTSYCDHDYFSLRQETSEGLSNATTTEGKSDAVFFSRVAPSELTVLTSGLLMEVKRKVDCLLPHRWISVVDGEKIHVMCLSAKNNKAVQRTLEFSSHGSVELFVHRKPVPMDQFLVDVYPPLPLDPGTVNNLVDRIVTIVNNVRNMEVCSGYDELKYEEVWSSCPYGEVDKNAYGECRFVETFRSLRCLSLVKNNKWRCCECAKMAAPLRRRARAAAEEDHSKFTANKFLNEEQKLKKLADQRKGCTKLRAYAAYARPY